MINTHKERCTLKKAKRLLSMLLVLTMILSVMSGQNIITGILGNG